MSTGDGLAEGPTGFFVMTTGQIRRGEFADGEKLYCKFDVAVGPDWKVVQGKSKGLSQVAVRSTGGDDAVVWNYPIDVSFKATNAFGWPRFVISVFEVDALGRDVIVGYGSLAVPTVPGRYSRYVRCFAPVSSSLFQEFAAWLTGNRPEFVQAKFVAQGEAREVTRVKSTGVVQVDINVLTRGMSEHGYATGGPPDAAVASGGAGSGGGGGGNASGDDGARERGSRRRDLGASVASAR